MSITLDLTFTSDLSDKSSSAYKDLESKIINVLRKQYSKMSGFVDVFVTGFRKGSVITDFVVKTSSINAAQLNETNAGLAQAMQPIAPVLSISTQYNSLTPISVPNSTYTGQSMTLKCDLGDFNVGRVSNAVWKLNETVINQGSRLSIFTTDSQSTFTVSKVILDDIGLYECILKGERFDFFQKGSVTGENIKSAPVVRVSDKINVKCTQGYKQVLQCCVQAPYTVEWIDGSNTLASDFDKGTNCIKHETSATSCSGAQTLKFTCRVKDVSGYDKTTELVIFKEDPTCNDEVYGSGRVGDTSIIGCGPGQQGAKTAQCQETREWKLVADTCIVTKINELLIASEDLAKEQVQNFTVKLSSAVLEERTKISNSSATIVAIVDIVNTIANISTTVNKEVMKNVLLTVDVIISEETKNSWVFLNANTTQNASSELLGSLEKLSGAVNETFDINTQVIQLRSQLFNHSFQNVLNSSVFISIPTSDNVNVFITTIIFSTLNNVMPTRNSTFNITANSNNTSSDNAINAAVLLVKISKSINNVSLSFNKLNSSLSLNPQCVFWNFTLFNKIGAWDDKGCFFVNDQNGTINCSCNHLTSFSILMATDIPPSVRDLLDVITYVGVGISLASLVICLIIEGYVWREITRNSTAFMRHVSIINTAFSLLIADICFIIGASLAKNPLENPGENYVVPVIPCTTATFFMHFFYLALFFWMLVSGLLLFYRTVMVFSHMSKSTMLAIGFTLGYGCPLIIAVITVGVTFNSGYIRKDYACWLNWTETKALLALVIPALTIVFINSLIVIVVLFKMLRRGVGDTAQQDEKHTLMVILRCVAILTPLFGLTWSLGVGTMVSSTDKGIHIAFAFFNSLQGLFILVFGTLFDSKIRSLLTRRVPTVSSSSSQTRSTSAGISSWNGLNLLSRLRGRRNIYHVSQAEASNSNSNASESFISNP